MRQLHNVYRPARENDHAAIFVTKGRHLAALAAVSAWLGLALQLFFSISDMTGNGFGTPGAIWRYLGYFTILTNILVAAVATRAALQPDARDRINAPRFEMAVAAAILIVGIVYGVLLAHMFSHTGIRWVTDALLHKATPALFALLWWTRRTGQLQWRDLIWAPALPAVYAVYALARGQAEGWYAYWFFDAGALGFAEMLRNAAGLLAATLAVGAVLIWADRIYDTRRDRGLE